MRISAWQNSGSYFTYKSEHQIFYKDSGNGPVLLLLHGFPTASWDWHKMWASLKSKFRVIALDYIGFGFSDKPKNYPYSLFDQANLVETLLKSLQIETVHVLAHDYGDTVLQELLARQNEVINSFIIQSAILLNGGIFPETIQPLPIQKALVSPLGFMLRPFLTKQRLRANFNRIFGPETQATEQELDEFYALMNFKNGRAIFHKLIRYMKERINNRNRWVGALEKAQIPMCLIIGTEDPISGRHIAHRYQELVPNPNIILLEKIGHYPQTEAPDLVLIACIGFWKMNH